MFQGLFELALVLSASPEDLQRRQNENNIYLKIIFYLLLCFLRAQRTCREERMKIIRRSEYENKNKNMLNSASPEDLQRREDENNKKKRE